jgi:nucleotide-binding universal stress UspA family protein
MYKRILVPIDGSKLSDKALASAIKIAKLTKAPLAVLHVVSHINPIVFTDGNFPADAEWMDKYEKSARKEGRQHLRKAADAAKSAGVRCTTRMLTSSQPHQAIIATARSRGCDLIVMASHGRRGLSAMLLGSETIKVLTHCKRPVLVVR